MTAEQLPPKSGGVVPDRIADKPTSRIHWGPRVLAGTSHSKGAAVYRVNHADLANFGMELAAPTVEGQSAAPTVPAGWRCRRLKLVGMLTAAGFIFLINLDAENDELMYPYRAAQRTFERQGIGKDLSVEQQLEQLDGQGKEEGLWTTMFWGMGAAPVVSACTSSPPAQWHVEDSSSMFLERLQYYTQPEDAECLAPGSIQNTVLFVLSLFSFCPHDRRWVILCHHCLLTGPT